MAKAGGTFEGSSAGPARLASRVLLTGQSDERLVQLAREGSEPAFEAIVERYRGPLRGYCRRLAPPSRVDDLVQQTFIATYSTLQSDGRDLVLKPWLFRVAHNAAMDALRRDARSTQAPDEPARSVERPDQALDRKESLRELVDGLSDLPDRQRSALVLRELEGRSYKEIGRELHASRGSVRQLLYRARSNLRAAATAVTPHSLLLRADGGEQLVSAAVGGAVVAKAGAALATTAVIGAVALSAGGGAPDALGGEGIESGGRVTPSSPSPPAERADIATRPPWATERRSNERQSDESGGSRAGEPPARGEDAAPRADEHVAAERDPPPSDDDAAGGGDDSALDDDGPPGGGNDSAAPDDDPEDGALSTGAPGDDGEASEDADVPAAPAPEPAVGEDDDQPGDSAAEEPPDN